MKTLLMVALLLCGGCDDMSHQPKALDNRPTPGLRELAPPAGTVARGQLQDQATLSSRPPIDAALLARGEERYGIYCTPCHGLSGLGDGRIVQRGFSAPPAFTDERLRTAPDDYLLQVIAQGHGLMYGYGARVAAADRWAIVAHLRVLQLSQHADVSQLPPALLQSLESVGRAR
ncbi:MULTISPECIES: cytochrome c [unclassified Pseudomonas]|uniref:c-type cytochrome n=1 Tax=unclassified Pseudomonas TaxID=196821 RepID=UPI002AC8FC10|nr:MULTISPECIES: cytochrome c [unclassified Pseudomonas]MEB0040038.1 cytochrome c [Pseudomonas sp. MH10]MEB0119563.1 cytochrome c [Pseudomonas sp. CCI1.2]WPX65168.1 cytochrome c [Pseudomonas sp. MH10]